MCDPLMHTCVILLNVYMCDYEKYMCDPLMHTSVILLNAYTCDFVKCTHM